MFDLHAVLLHWQHHHVCVVFSCCMCFCFVLLRCYCSCLLDRAWSALPWLSVCLRTWSQLYCASSGSCDHWLRDSRCVLIVECLCHVVCLCHRMSNSIACGCVEMCLRVVCVCVCCRIGGYAYALCVCMLWFVVCWSLGWWECSQCR